MSADSRSCFLCPRRCGVNREAGARGVCGEGASVRLARAALHHWEEPPISGRAGSGTVFFSGCPLKCVYCQNLEISRGIVGREVSVKRLAQIFLEQQARGALNLNLVTATQFAPQVVTALELARAGEIAPRTEMLPEGMGLADAPHELTLPVVWNTSGYETPETIEMLHGHVDVYLADFKYASSELAAKYSGAGDYPHVANEALDAMYEAVGPVAFGTGADGEQGILQRGVVVRHLMLPGQLQDSLDVVSLVALKPYADKLIMSLMSQYTPVAGVGERFPELARTVAPQDYDVLVDWALELGLEKSFMQEGGAAEESFIPAFDYEGV